MGATPPRQVLVATDLSDQAGLAVRRAAQLTTQHNTRLAALHVLPAGLDVELTGFADDCLRSHLGQYANSVGLNRSCVTARWRR